MCPTTIFGELSANRKTPAETAALVTSVLTYADELSVRTSTSTTS